MAKEKQPTQQTSAQISIAAQYVKDISFESPNAPHSLRPSDKKPNINVSVDVKADTLGKDTFEIELKISASGKREGEKGKDETVFICEVTYAGVFVIVNVPKEEMEPALLIFCPNLLFPYIRRVISDITRDGGFPALMLDPIDFGRLYQQRTVETKN
jgi:preprotein translocase subunit SecB